MRRGTPGSQKVVLNVYDLNPYNEYLFPVGLGVHHSGLQLGSFEYTFANGGIFSHAPRQAPGVPFRETIELGVYSGSAKDLDRIMDKLRDSFPGSSYNVLLKNCNHFAVLFHASACVAYFPDKAGPACWALSDCVGRSLPCAAGGTDPGLRESAGRYRYV